MSCVEYRELLIEAARGGEVPAHVRCCAECEAFLGRQTRLSAALAELRTQASAAAFAACPSPPVRRRASWSYAAASGALAASMLLAWALHRANTAGVPPPATAIVRPALAPPLQPAVAPASVAASASRRVRRKRPPIKPAPEQEFVAIPYTVPLAQNERAQVWRMEMPVSELIAAGMPISAPDISSIARADVVVGEDGRARAFRLISVTDSSSNRSIYK